MSEFNIREYLNSRGVPFFTEGGNTSESWISLQCPFCADRSNHMGINEDGDFFSCWICKEKGSIAKLVMKLERCSWDRARAITGIIIPKGMKIKQPGKVCILPPEAGDLTDLHKSYLKVDRGFDPNEIIRKYGITGTGPTGDFAYRIIIPVYYRKKLVSFTGRDITGKQTLRYKACPVEESVVPCHHCLYWIDHARNTAIVVEGPMDVWRIGDGAVALFGNEATPSQMLALSKFQRVFVLLDSDAWSYGTKLAKNLSTRNANVSLIQLDSGDPADMDQDDVQHLRRVIFGKVY